MGSSVFKFLASIINYLLGAVVALFLVYLDRGFSPDWPSWVQAVGSVLAILVAVRIASSQARQQQAAAHRKDVVAVKALQVLSERAFRICEGMINYNPQEQELTGASLVPGLRKSFEDISILDLPEPALIDSVCTIRDSMFDIQKWLVDCENMNDRIAYANSQRFYTQITLVMVSTNSIINVFNKINKSSDASHPDHVPQKRPRTDLTNPGTAD
ncbi:hypothetical protein [Pseudomonas sp. ADAK13]|uniref:hypothetical protein n=1 Tax=Pseudomonas sp. ADAK13 TaxID=2730847 RepID=UPI001464834D|nr:hypothetical protein [Pseudomonas sp. ADAK13]QJI38266.1 hypothetical protein HKK54_28985 [Pseudomonas sp. ADAK13]